MKSTITFQDVEIEFWYDIEKGQSASFCSPEYADTIIDLDWLHESYSKELNDAIWNDLQNIERLLLIDADKQKEEAEYDSATGGLD